MTVLPVAAVSALWIMADLGTYRKDSAALRGEYVESRKSALEHEVHDAIEYVQYVRSLAEQRLMEDIQQEVLERISRITVGDDGVVFVGRWDGSALPGPSQGPRMVDDTDAKGAEVIQRLIAAARVGGGFVSYSVSRPGEAEPVPRLSYVAPIADWEWYVGCDMDMGQVEAALAAGEREMARSTRLHILQAAVLLGVILALILIPGRFVLRDLDRSFAEFGAFFRRAAEGAARVDPARLKFRELRELADSANAMTERRLAAESALRESEERYRTLLAASFEGVAVSEDGKIIDVTPQLAEMLGYRADEVIGRQTLELVFPGDREAMSGATAEGDERPRQIRLVRKDGSLLDAESRARYFEYRRRRVRMIAIRDITERVRTEQTMSRLQAELYQAQKMEAVGRLAGGIAHDFNNLLTAVIGYSDLILAEAELGASAREGVDEIRKAALGAAALTQQLLAYSRKQILRPRVMDLNALVHNLQKMLTRLIGEDILLVSTLEANPADVSADPSQVEQVVLNLAVNARDAMPKGGTLTVGTENVSLDGRDAEGLPDLKHGEYVLLSVKDTGSGMDDEVKSHLFEPFFTTKEMGKGTGLGLSTVYGIVKQSDGQIVVLSEPGKGAIFRIYLPRADREAAVGGEAPGVRGPAGGR